MTGTVSYIFDQRVVWIIVRIRQAFVQNFAEGVDNFKIGRLVIPSHIIGFSDITTVDHPPDGFAMIPHIEPIADLLSIAINWERLALNSV